MEKSKLVFGMLFFIIVGLVFGLVLGDIIIKYHFSVASSVPCDGLLKYYTGEGFNEDIHNAHFFSHYKTTNDGFDISNDPDADTWDCEDISHAIYCMAKEYDIKCEFYYGKYYNNKVINKDHFGIDCFVDGEWRDYN